jgi:hypothetical protein
VLLDDGHEQRFGLLYQLQEVQDAEGLHHPGETHQIREHDSLHPAKAGKDGSVNGSAVRTCLAAQRQQGGKFLGVSHTRHSYIAEAMPQAVVATYKPQPLLYPFVTNYFR